MRVQIHVEQRQINLTRLHDGRVVVVQSHVVQRSAEVRVEDHVHLVVLNTDVGILSIDRNIISVLTLVERRNVDGERVTRSVHDIVRSTGDTSRLDRHKDAHWQERSYAVDELIAHSECSLIRHRQPHLLILFHREGILLFAHAVAIDSHLVASRDMEALQLHMERRIHHDRDVHGLDIRDIDRLQSIRRLVRELYAHVLHSFFLGDRGDQVNRIHLQDLKRRVFQQSAISLAQGDAGVRNADSGHRHRRTRLRNQQLRSDAVQRFHHERYIQHRPAFLIRFFLQATVQNGQRKTVAHEHAIRSLLEGHIPHNTVHHLQAA